MFGRVFVNKLPVLIVLVIIGILELQILRISEIKRQPRSQKSFHEEHKNFIESNDAKSTEYEDDQVTGRNTERTAPNTMVGFDDHSNDDDAIILYNRVPKTASTSFMGVVYDLCEQNLFHSIHLNITKNQHTLSVTDQLRLANNITRWTDRLPALYHGHVEYINFRKLGVSKRIFYINIIRKPLDRLVSYYYFLRFGDTFRPHKRRSRQGDKETFDECVQKQHRDCKPERLWLQIPFFCGHAPQCQNPGNKWALEQAKRHLLEDYLLVGLTEELEDFIAVLETVLPRFFRGATKVFLQGEKSHLRKTASKKPLEESTIIRFQQNKVWKMENEFYEFAKKVFYTEKKRTFVQRNNGEVSSPVQFFYEKIRPRTKYLK